MDRNLLELLRKRMAPRSAEQAQAQAADMYGLMMATRGVAEEMPFDVAAQMSPVGYASPSMMQEGYAASVPDYDESLSSYLGELLKNPALRAKLLQRLK